MPRAGLSFRFLPLVWIQFFYLKSQIEEIPILLLDDLFGNLDEQRTRIFIELLKTDVIGQSLITAAQRGPFDKLLTFDGIDNRELYIEQGRYASPA